VLLVLSKFTIIFYVSIMVPIFFRSKKNPKKLINVKEASRETVLCLAAAHALVRLDDGTVVGDPMEKTTLDALEWQLLKGIYPSHFS